MEASKKHNLAIPKEARHSNWWDMFATWLGANANNGTWFVGGVMAACGLAGGFNVLLWSSALSYLFLALVGYMGYRTGVATMTLSRAAFGIRGSILPSLINITLFVGWTAVNTYIAAQSCGVLLHDLVGLPNLGQAGGIWGVVLGILVMSVLHIVSVSGGAKSIQLIERLGIILVMVFMLWETVVVLRAVPFAKISAWHVPAASQMTTGAAVDYVAAFNLAWVTAGADFTRFTRKATHATIATYWGALLGVLWFALVGLVATISVAVASGAYDPNNSDPSTIASKLGLGIIALIVIILTSMTANAVNLLGAASAVANISAKVNLKKALWLVVAAATVLTFVPLVLGSFLATFEAFLDYIAMVLGPLIAIICADYFILRRSRVDVAALNERGGKYWYNGGINWWAFISLALGISVFLALKQWHQLQASVGVTFVAMLITAVLYLGGMRGLTRLFK